MHPGHPIAAQRNVALADLVGQDLVVTHPRSLIRQRLDELFRELGRLPKVRFETTSGAVACQLASRGLGLAVADPFVARSSVGARLAMRRFRPAIALPYGILFPVWQPRSEAVAEFASLIAEAGRKHAAALMRGLRRAATEPPDDAAR